MDSSVIGVLYYMQIAILIDLVREEIVAERNQGTSSENCLDIHVEKRKGPFWSSYALDLVGLVLKPPKGGPPSLPEDSDPVLLFSVIFSCQVPA